MNRDDLLNTFNPSPNRNLNPDPNPNPNPITESRESLTHVFVGGGRSASPTLSMQGQVILSSQPLFPESDFHVVPFITQYLDFSIS